MTEPASDRRRRREAGGRSAERLAAWWLMLRGWEILERRWASPVGEIDLVARRGRLVAFVEVKRRATLDEALASLQPRQLARIARAAEAYRGRLRDAERLDFRIDLLALAPWRLPRHVPDIGRDAGPLSSRRAGP